MKLLDLFRATSSLFLFLVALSPMAAAAKGEWVEWQGIHVRIDASGNVSCRSSDGVNCAGPGDRPPEKRSATSESTGLHQLVRGLYGREEAEWKSLSCGNEHRKHYGISGYERADHWCNAAYAALFAKWTDYRPLGIDMLLSTTAQGHVMCHSFDGVNCSHPADVERKRREAEESALRSALCRKVASSFPGLPSHVVDRCAEPERPPVKALICGEHHRSLWEIDGYGTPGHWCRAPEILRHERFDDLVLKPGDTKAIPMGPWHLSRQPGVLVTADVEDGSWLTFNLSHNPSELDMSAYAGGPSQSQLMVKTGGNLGLLRDPLQRQGNKFVGLMMRFSAKGTMCYHTWSKDGPISLHAPNDSSLLIRARSGLGALDVLLWSFAPTLRLHANDGPVRIREVIVVAARRFPPGLGLHRSPMAWSSSFYSDECDGLAER